MYVTVLGCQAGMPDGGRASSGYVVTTASCRLLLDCGPGVATALSGHVGAAGLDAIVISHLHPDHCYDLLPVGTTLLRHARPIPLYLPRGGAALLAALGALFPARPGGASPSFHEAFAVHEYGSGDTARLGDCTVTLYQLRHAMPNCGVRIHDGTVSLAYTGDTGPTATLLALAGGVDLLLAEATMVDGDAGEYGHLSATDAGRLAAEAAVGQLVLTHLFATDADSVRATAAEAARVFSGPVQVAQPGACYRVGPAN